MAFVPALPVSLNTLGTRHNSLCRVLLRRRSIRAIVPRMVATEPVTEASTSETLSDRAMELISYIRGHKSIFRPGIGFSSVSGTLCRKNDTARLFTPPDELKTNAKELPGVSVALLIHDQAESLIEAALNAAENVYPPSTSDQLIADIVHHDLTTVLRAVSFGIAVRSEDFLHDNNAAMMKALHDEVGFPGQAMVAALNTIRDIILSQTGNDLHDITASCFQAACDVFA